MSPSGAAMDQSASAMPVGRSRHNWPPGEGSPGARRFVCALCSRTSALILTGVLEWATDLRVTGVAGPGSAGPEGPPGGQHGARRG